MCKKSWAGYCLYLKNWANDHSDVGFEGCCPVCYDEYLDSEWQLEQEEGDETE